MSEERIPTMPQGGERIPTMPQGGERIPTMPQGGERIPTMPQGGERIPTMPQGGERIPTMPQGEERIPTMPQGGERIPTMPQGGERIPTMPQGGERIPTVPQGDGRIPTVPQESGAARAAGRVATVPQSQPGAPAGGAYRRGSRILMEDFTFTGGEGTFVLEAQNIVSADSGESQIYRCRTIYGDPGYVARILTAVTPASSARVLAVREKVLHFLAKASRDPEAHILPLVDCGTANIYGKEYFVEIYPFCSGGDLGKRAGDFSCDELREKVIPGVNEALKRFHDAGFVHRDLKPDNLYFYNGRVVLGDFGITSDLDENEYATDRLKKGTLGYYAPELMSGAAVKASDYYSFGQTLWTLYSGEMMYQYILRRNDAYHSREGLDRARENINNAMMKNEYHGLDEISPKDSFFKTLITGLLRYDVTSRYKYEEVVRWLKGDKSLIGEGFFKEPYNINGEKCWDTQELCLALEKNWEEAKYRMYNLDRENSLFKLYAVYDIEIASLIQKIVKENNQPDIGLAKLLMELESGNPLVWCGKKYESLLQMSEEIHTELTTTGTLVMDASRLALFSTELPEVWYRKMAEKQNAYDDEVVRILEVVRAVAGKNQYGQAVAYYTVMMLFSQNGSLVAYCGCRDLDELAVYITNTKADFCEKLIGIADSPQFCSFLLTAGYRKLAIWRLNHRNLSDFDKMEWVFELLDSQVTKVEVRQQLLTCYLERGPYSYLWWWKNHLDLYSFHGKTAEKVKKGILDCRLDDVSVEKIRKRFEGLLRQDVKQFRSLFVDNIFLANMGFNLGKEQNGITSTRPEAYWHYNFYGHEAPLGFMETLGRKEA